MAIRQILTVWSEDGINKENINFLKQTTKKVFLPTSANIDAIIDDLISTYQDIPCAGIAANQIGFDKRIFIGIKEPNQNLNEHELEEKERDYLKNPDLKNEYHDNYEIYINPQIDSFDQSSIQEEVEGCLSFPGLSMKIQRYDKIRVRYYNRSGKCIKRSMKGFMSKLFQHELDHLNGKLMVESNVIEVYSEQESFVDAELYNNLMDSI